MVTALLIAILLLQIVLAAYLEMCRRDAVNDAEHIKDMLIAILEHVHRSPLRGRETSPSEEAREKINSIYK